MKLTDLSLEGFGVLSQLRLEDLDEGLNVIHGPNGAGKTTLLHFLRGVFCGFEEASRLRLLPPLKGGSPGGSIAIQTRAGRCTVIRQFRPDHADTLAINVRQGGQEAADAVRLQLATLNKPAVQTLFTVTNYEAHALESLVKLAITDGIDLLPHREDVTWLSGHLQTLPARRAQLLEDLQCEGSIAALNRQRAQLQQTVDALQQEFQARHQQLAAAHRGLRAEIDRCQQNVDTAHLEWQAIDGDVRELEDRLWAVAVPAAADGTCTAAAEAVPPVAPASTLTPDWLDEVRHIDDQIARAQQVLRDLAASRLQLSLKSADFAGSATPGPDVFFARQRAAVGRLERYILRLQSELEQVRQEYRIGNCVCQEMGQRATASLNALRQQIYAMCQELSRHEAVHRQGQVDCERDGVDRCEFELRRQVERLALRRDKLLSSEHVRRSHRSAQEAQFCGCADHEAFIQQRASQRPAAAHEDSAAQVATAESAAVLSRRQEDQARLAALQELRSARRAEWESAVATLHAAVQRGELLARDRAAFAADRRLADQQFALSSVEQQLSDAREEWQTLTLLQGLLTQIQVRRQAAVYPPVVQEAAAYLKRLTHERYMGIRVLASSLPSNYDVLVLASGGTELPLPALSRGTLDQVALSVRLALANEYARRGMEFPLVLDDVLTDSDEGRLRSAVELLHEVAQGGRQILFLTCQQHLTDLFESSGLTIRDFPGTFRRRRTRSTTSASTPAVATSSAPAAESPAASDRAGAEPLEQVMALVADAPAADQPPAADQSDAAPPVTFDPRMWHRNFPIAETSGQEAAVADELAPGSTLAGAPRFHRVHPGEPYWLRADSPLSLIPSIGEQMARRLGTLGLRTIADLIEFDPESSQMPLDSLQIFAARLRIWQAEARLLCCVAELTGRDAQLLVSCGILTPAELAEVDPGVLLARIARMRGSQPETWQAQDISWPSPETIQRWTRNARRARTFREACLALGRDHQERPRGPHFLGERRSSAQRTDARRQRRRLTLRRFEERPLTTATEPDAGASQAAPPRPQLFSAEPGTERTWKFYLNADSPIVDAPSIGPTTARRLEKAGIATVADLLNRDPQDLALQVDHERITAEVLRLWQQQARLMCRVPELRGHDAQLLVACGLTDAEEVAQLAPQALFERVAPFAATKEGQRLLRSSKAPDLAEVTDWITWAQHARNLRAA